MSLNKVTSESTNCVVTSPSDSPKMHDLPVVEVLSI